MKKDTTLLIIPISITLIAILISVIIITLNKAELEENNTVSQLSLIEAEVDDEVEPSKITPSTPVYYNPPVVSPDSIDESLKGRAIVADVSDNALKDTYTKSILEYLSTLGCTNTIMEKYHYDISKDWLFSVEEDQFRAEHKPSGLLLFSSTKQGNTFTDFYFVDSSVLLVYPEDISIDTDSIEAMREYVNDYYTEPTDTILICDSYDSISVKFYNTQTKEINEYKWQDGLDYVSY